MVATNGTHGRRMEYGTGIILNISILDYIEVRVDIIWGHLGSFL